MQRTFTRALILITLAGISLGLASVGRAAQLTGTVHLSDSGRNSAEARYAIVYFTPDSDFTAPQPRPDGYEVLTVRKEFQPRVSTVPVGSTVEFTNGDAILHNAFSLTPGTNFDLGLFGKNEKSTFTFEQPGAVRIFCNVHHSMVAYVLVLETPYFTSADSRGRFSLDNLPSGPGTLSVWHERTESWVQHLRLPAAKSLDLELKVTKPKIPKHLNKHGKRYSRRRRGSY